MKRILNAGIAVALIGSAGLAAAQPAMAAKKYTACVKKSSGEMRVLLGKSKKCQKGWKKQTWKKAGPKGPAGSTGASNSFGTVVDANSNVVGLLMGFYPIAVGFLDVRIDGGIYSFTPGGRLVPLDTDIDYDNPACSGAPFKGADSEFVRDVYLQDPSLRIVYRTTVPTLGPASAYKMEGSVTSVVALSLWHRDASGACVANGSLTGYRLPLTEVTAPPDRPGPLRVS